MHLKVMGSGLLAHQLPYFHLGNTGVSLAFDIFVILSKLLRSKTQFRYITTLDEEVFFNEVMVKASEVLPHFLQSQRSPHWKQLSTNG
jgi:hypothetical protein